MHWEGVGKIRERQIWASLNIVIKNLGLVKYIIKNSQLLNLWQSTQLYRIPQWLCSSHSHPAVQSIEMTVAYQNLYQKLLVKNQDQTTSDGFGKTERSARCCLLSRHQVRKGKFHFFWSYKIVITQEWGTFLHPRTQNVETGVSQVKGQSGTHNDFNFRLNYMHAKILYQRTKGVEFDSVVKYVARMHRTIKNKF